MIRRILALTLSFAIATPAMAGVTQDPEQIMGMVNEFVQEMKAIPENADPSYKQAQADLAAEDIAVQLRGLPAEDFNLFMYAVMSRYINKPEERESLFAFISASRTWIEADLANTALLDNGPISYMNMAQWSKYTWIAIGTGMVLSTVLLKGPMRNMRFVQAMNRAQMKMTAMKQTGFKQNPFKYIGARAGLAATHPMTIWLGAGGMIGGLAEYGIELNRVHRMDPVVMLTVVQTQLACALSYRGLDIDDHINAISMDEAKLRTDFKPINQEIEALKKESEVLAKHFARLDNITSADPDLQKAMSKIPKNLPEKYANLQAFRESLVTDGPSINGRCRQISLTDLDFQLDQRAANLKTFYDVNVGEEQPADVSPQQ